MFVSMWRKLSALAVVLGLVVGSIGSAVSAYAQETETLVLSEEEQKYIEEGHTLKVGYVQDRKPVSFKTEDGELGGITRYILDRLAELSGLTFEYEALPTGSVTYDYLLSEGFDLVTSVEYNEENKAARGILISNPYLNSQKVIVAREGVDFSYSKHMKVAISSGSQTIRTVLGRMFPNFEQLNYDSMEECLNAIRKGEADLLIQNQYVVEYWLHKPLYESLKVIPIVGIEDSMCFSAVVPLEKNDSPEWQEKEVLISILDQAIAGLSEDETAMYIIETTMENQYEYTVSDFLYRYRVAAMTMLIAVICIVVLLLLLLRARLHSLEERANARAKGRFLSTMSHEIRTPLNGLLGLNYLMSQNLNEPQKLENYLRQSATTARYLLSLVNDILDMSRLQENRMILSRENVNLRLLVSTVSAIVEGDMKGKGLDFRIDAELPYPGVVGDGTRIQQILLNILDNARKFTSSGGQVTFTVRQELRRDEKVFTSFRVRDTGCGMSEEFRKHIFDSFTQELGTVSKGNQGTGLGMAISYQLARLMEGSLEVSSRKGEGSEFIFSFPAPLAIEEAGTTDWERGAEDAAGGGSPAAKNPVQRSEDPNTERPGGQEQTSAPAGSVSGSGRRRVLVAEDNELNAEILLELLHEEGIEADLAENGREAVRRFSASAVGEYGVILMDLLMPEMNGFEAAEAIRALERPDAPTVRIYACTANSFQEDRDKARASGMDDFITKPIDVGLLLEKLIRFL